MRFNYTKQIIFFILFAIIGSVLWAQAPQYTYGDNTGTDGNPLNSSVNNKEQWLYVMSDFTPAVPAGVIESIYVRRANASTTSTSYTDFTIKIGHIPNTQTEFANTNYITGLQTVVAATTHSLPAGAAGDWIEIPLTNPFIYDGTSNLVVEMSQNGGSGINLRPGTLTGTNNRRLYSNNTSTTSANRYTGPKNLGLDINTDPCDNTVTPSNWGIMVGADLACVGDDFNMQVTELLPGVGLTYQFQYSLDGGTIWLDLGAPNITGVESFDNILQNTQFRVQWLCNGVVQYSSTPVLVEAIDPEIYSVQNAERCGPGPISLSATSTPGSTISWFDNPNGGVPIHEGNTYNIPNLTNTTSYWVNASVEGSSSYSDSLETIFSGGNQCGGGIMFDLTPERNLEIDSFKVLTKGSGTQFKIYYKLGTHAGNETNAGAWTLHETINRTYGSNETHILPLSSPIELDANQVYGIYLYYYSSYTNGNNTYSNADLTFEGGIGLCNEFSGLNIPRVFNGTIYYGTKGCSSDFEEVIATINPEVIPSLPDTFSLCTSQEHPGILDAGSHPNNVTYLWDDGSTGRYREVINPGTYWVDITNEYGCTVRDSVYANVQLNPIVNLGSDTILCIGAEITLDAGSDGQNYSWNTGATGRYLTVNSPGTYQVVVQAANGCVVVDSIKVEQSSDVLAKIDGIFAQNIDPYTFRFEAINPQYVDEYFWSFGDGTYSADINPFHTYSAKGNYVVHLEVSNSCGEVYDSISTHVVSIEENTNGNDAIQIYPNPSNGKITIKNTSSKAIERILITDVQGRIVLEESIKEEEINLEENYMDLTHLVSGVYWVQIYTDDGIIIKKLKLL